MTWTDPAAAPDVRCTDTSDWMTELAVWYCFSSVGVADADAAVAVAVVALAVGGAIHCP